MKELISVNGSQTMTSVELRDIINAARVAHGESKVRNDKLLARIEDELSGELGVCKTFTHPQSGVKMRYYDLSRDQCTLVGMRESKSVRRSVLEKLKEIDRAVILPTVKDPQLAAMVTMLTQLDSVKQEQEYQRNELKELRAKITASPQDYFTIAGYASLRGISVDVKEAARLGRLASKLSVEYQLDTGTAHSELFGKVKTYHVDVLCSVFEGK